MLTEGAPVADGRVDVVPAAFGAVKLASGFEADAVAAGPGSVQGKETVGRAVGTILMG